MSLVDGKLFWISLQKFIILNMPKREIKKTAISYQETSSIKNTAADKKKEEEDNNEEYERERSR